MIGRNGARHRGWRIGLWSLLALLILTTVLPLILTDEWWIRIFDFPRTQIAGLLAAALVAVVAVLDRRRAATWALTAGITICLAYQIWRILPYTPIHPVEAIAAASCPGGQRITLIIANVEFDNRQSRPLLDLVREREPDLLLVVEATPWWDRALQPLAAEYPFVVRQPRTDPWGMILYSRLELVAPEMRFLLHDYVPSIRTRVRLPSDAVVQFYGLHPHPPRPGDDTDRRDAELLIVAREAREAGLPSIVAGDLNDVAWSRTTRLFQEISGLLDPRIGRGLYPTFNAEVPFLRWPLDHVFFEEEFALLAIERLRYIGSDHFPLFTALCLWPAIAAVQDEPQPEGSARERAEDIVREGREEAREPE